jgi:hypothetical protein
MSHARFAILVSLLGGCPSTPNNASCPAPFQLCGAVCTATAVDPANCGSCGTACAPGERCASGSCSITCPAGSTACGSTCVDVSSSNQNCGACGTVCAAGQMCSAGKCATTCASGYMTCGSGASAYCAATTIDSQNCGTCGNTCPSGQRCAAGACSDSCATGLMVCGGSCVDVMTNAAHCGACDKPCPTGEACVGGACQCGWVTMSMGWTQTCALRADATVVCAGPLNTGCSFNQNADGSPNSTCAGSFGVHTLPPTTVAGLTSVRALDGGQGFLCALKTDGTVWCLGTNRRGQLGTGDVVPSPRPSPSQVRESNAPTFLTNVKQISAGGLHACALKNNGEIWCWGSGASGELANGLSSSSLALRAELPPGLTNVKKVVAGGDHTCAIAGDDSVWCWGRNQAGQLGYPQTGNPNVTPSPVPVLAGVVDLTSELHHNCALKSDKTVWCWGSNRFAQVGQDPAILSVPTPTPLPLTDVAEVISGSAHNCARKSDGTVWCWGYNAHGEIGNNTYDATATYETSGGNSGLHSPSPHPVVTAAGTLLVVKSIAVHHGRACGVVGPSDHPWCWGKSQKGQAILPTPFSTVATPSYSCGF